MLHASVSHEMMTPLRCITSFGLAAAQEASGPAQKKKIDLIVYTAKLLQCQFKDLLDRNLLEKGMIDPAFEEASIWEIITETVLILKGQMDLKQIQLSQKIEELKGKHFQIDVMRLQQVLINLITNAIKYSPMETSIIINAKLRPTD